VFCRPRDQSIADRRRDLSPDNFCQVRRASRERTTDDDEVPRAAEPRRDLAGSGKGAGEVLPGKYLAEGMITGRMWVARD